MRHPRMVHIYRSRIDATMRTYTPSTVAAWAAEAGMEPADFVDILLDSDRPWRDRLGELDAHGRHFAQATARNVASSLRRQGLCSGKDWGEWSHRPTVRADDDGGVAEARVDDAIISSDEDMLRLAGLDPNVWELDDGSRRIWAHEDGDGRMSLNFGFRRRHSDSELSEWLETVFTPPEPVEPPSTKPGDPMIVCVADLQLGKAGERLGGTKQLIRRFHSVLAQLRGIMEHERPSELVIADLGDSIENVTSHTGSSQAASNDLPVSEQMRVVARLFMEAVTTLSPYAGRTVLAGVRSNHGEERLADGKTNRHGDYGTAVIGMVGDALAALDSTVETVVQNPLEPGVRMTVGGMPIALTHGHDAKRVTRMGDWVAHQSGGLRPSVFDGVGLVLHGHYHHLTVQESRGRLIIGCPSLESGSDWLAKTCGEYSLPGVLTLRVHDNRPSDIRVLTPTWGMTPVRDVAEEEREWQD